MDNTVIMTIWTPWSLWNLPRIPRTRSLSARSGLRRYLPWTVRLVMETRVGLWGRNRSFLAIPYKDVKTPPQLIPGVPKVRPLRSELGSQVPGTGGRREQALALCRGTGPGGLWTCFGRVACRFAGMLKYGPKSRSSILPTRSTSISDGWRSAKAG